MTITFVTDGGIETDLIFNRGIDLPEFASFPLIDLDDGDPEQLAADRKPLLDAFPNLDVLGGCCGTDARHVGAMWGVRS